MMDFVDRYRQLVVAEESVETLDHALALAEDVAGIRLRWTAGRLDARTENGQRLPDLDLPELASVGARRRRARPRLEKQARTVRAAVTLAALPPLADEIHPPLGERRQSLLADACLVVFHQAYFALLPELKARDWADERRLLTESFHRFADHLPRTNSSSTNQVSPAVPGPHCARVKPEADRTSPGRISHPACHTLMKIPRR